MSARLWRMVCLGVVMALLIGVPAAGAQSRNSVLYGTVYDVHARPMGGVTIVLENPAIGFSRRTATAADGTYSFAEVPPAEGYKVTAESGGRVIDIRSGITVRPNEETVIFPALKESVSAQTPQNEALSGLRQRAAAGDPTAQHQLGSAYQNGTGVPKDDAEAVSWFRKAADQNYAPAQNYLGHMYQNGFGVTKNYDEAVKWYRKAADQNYPDAQYRMGDSYYHGWGVTQDYGVARSWYQKAADQNSADGTHMLGILYHFGRGVNRDDARALELFRKAADQDLATAQFDLGNSYRNGWGVPVDMQQARYWFQKAADHGNAEAKKVIAELDAGGGPQPVAATTGAMTVQSNPGNAEVYLDDVRQGTTSNEGKLIVRDLAPRVYRVRVSHEGYRDYEARVDVSAGQNIAVIKSLESTGPAPFGEAEIEKLLKGGVSPHRVGTLVQERGVDFALDKAIEKQLRAAGADSDLLLTIATSKK